MTQEQEIKENAEMQRKVTLLLAQKITKAAQQYEKAAGKINSPALLPFDESYIDKLDQASFKLKEAIKTAQMFYKFKR